MSDDAESHAPRWIDERYHVAFWAIAGIVAVATYLGTHEYLKDAYKESNAVTTALSAAAGNYAFEEDIDGRLELMIGGRPHDEAQGQAEPLGLGKLSSARGPLLEVEQAVGVFNRNVNTKVSSILELLRNSRPEPPNYSVTVPLHELGVPTNNADLRLLVSRCRPVPRDPDNRLPIPA